MTRRDFVATTGLGCLLASAVPRRDLERLKACARWATPERMRQGGWGEILSVKQTFVAPHWDAHAEYLRSLEKHAL
jgi:hypothetical protein